MHTDLIDRIITRRLRAAADEPSEAPFDWAEFQRRRRRSLLTRAIERHRPAAIGAAVVAAMLVTALPFVRSINDYVSKPPPADTTVRTEASGREGHLPGSRGAAEPGTKPERLAQARTRAIEGWLAGLPHDPVIVRVGTHAAVTSLQDQIAALDDLMTAERVAGARQARIDALARQRAQLVGSLAQLRYAEMLASAAP